MAISVQPQPVISAALEPGGVDHDKHCKEHDLPLVRRRRRRGGAFLRRNISGFIRGRGTPSAWGLPRRSEEHTSELQSRGHLVCRLLLEKKNRMTNNILQTLTNGTICNSE